MKEIILIEDRPQRQEQYFDKSKILKLNAITHLEIPTESDCREYIEQINSTNIKSLEDFGLIMIHRSSLNQKGLRAITDLCNRLKLDLILFSGGISQMTFHNLGFNSLSINSKDFYSNNLLAFLVKYIDLKIENLLELVYEKNWKLSFLLQYRQLDIIMKDESDSEYKLDLKNRLDEIKSVIKIDPLKIDAEINKIIALI